MPSKVGASSALLRAGLLCALGAGQPGCGFALRQEVEALKQQQLESEARQNAKLQQLQSQLDRERALREVDMRRVASRVECHSDRVRDFLKECEEGSDVCSEQGVANAFQFMITQPYVQIYMRPHQGSKGLVATRRGQLATMGDPKNWLPSTRFLVLVQPRSESVDSREEALRLGREIQRYLINDLFSDEKGVRVLGPKVLPCKMKADEVASHVRRWDVPVKGEPASHESSVRLWVFRTDC